MCIKSITWSPNQTQTKNRSVPSIKYKKYLNGSCRVVQSIFEPEVSSVEHQRITQKESITDFNVQINHKYKYLKHKYVLQIFNYNFFFEMATKNKYLNFK